ncbi:hypothetical protein ABFS83_06G040400 [Erythranthe nasuta]
MEGTSSFSFLQQEDELENLDFPELATIWDVGFDQIPPPKCIDLGGNENGKIPKKLEKNIIEDQLKKKRLHREVERQRRQEISTLYASLRSVLPPQHIKGKRSTTDQIDEAAKYIRHLQNNVKEMGVKIGNLKRWSTKNESEKGNPSKILPIVNVNYVTVLQTCSVGVEVLISTSGDILGLSRIMQLLLQQGLIVVSCSFTKFDGRLLYTIQSEVLDYNTGVDIQMLQRKLQDKIRAFY